jgi:succinate dehydrogenase/fumarate reductase flavoprotein subunit
MGIMAGPDLQAFLHTTTSVTAFFHAAWRVAFHVIDLITYRRGMQLVNGPSLIARLVKSADTVGVRMWVNSAATSLTTDDDGTVTGAVLQRPDGELTVRATRGVLLAAGGFPNDVARRRELFASGDPEHQPNPSLAPLEKGPFYAIKVLPGSFGTFFGLRADTESRVLRLDGSPVRGLYVAGSDQANVMGGHYPSGGINIGPAMTFGYINGHHVSSTLSDEIAVPTRPNDSVRDLRIIAAQTSAAVAASPTTATPTHRPGRR